jgi:hypothetical protein
MYTYKDLFYVQQIEHYLHMNKNDFNVFFRRVSS